MNDATEGRGPRSEVPAPRVPGPPSNPSALLVPRSTSVLIMLLVAALAGLALWSWGRTPFYDAFWPGLLSTFLGIFLGLPAALLLNQIAARYAEAAQTRAADDLRDRCLYLVRDALESNRTALRSIVATLEADQAHAILYLDAESWEATRYELARVLADIELRRDLATYFQKVRLLSSTYQRYADMTASGSAPWGPHAGARSTTRLELIRLATNIEAITGPVMEDIDRIARPDLRPREIGSGREPR